MTNITGRYDVVTLGEGNESKLKGEDRMQGCIRDSVTRENIKGPKEIRDIH